MSSLTRILRLSFCVFLLIETFRCHRQPDYPYTGPMINSGQCLKWSDYFGTVLNYTNSDVNESFPYFLVKGKYNYVLGWFLQPIIIEQNQSFVLPIILKKFTKI